MLDNARDEKIHELNFPGGNRGARRCVATPRAPSPAGKGPPQGKLIANIGNRSNDLTDNASNLDFSLFNPSACLNLLKSRTTTATYERLCEKLKGSV
jgi:hypothetical protein